MRYFLIAVLFAWVGSWVSAQTAPSGEFWVQVRAVPTAGQAIAQAERLERTFDNVVGFRIGGGWYGLALGPYDRNTASSELSRLFGQRLVPGDSFVANGTAYRQQFWPQDNTIPDRNVLYVPREERSIQLEVAIPTPTLTPLSPVEPGSGETVTDARTSEQAMTREEKRELQRALKWAGVYTAAIDGLYGRGTRSAMREWQRLQNAEPTGIMTSTQRAALLSDYNAVFDGLGLEVVDHPDAGVQIQIPTALVGDATREAPFVQYDAKNGSGVTLIVISQAGDAARMQALYDVLQTLDLIPAEGPRSIDRNGFNIEGIDGTRHTTAFARLSNGAIKGAILSWPANDTRRERVEGRIFDSFVTTDGTLPEAYFLNVGETPPDLVAGLTIRQPLFTLTGTYLDNRGHVMTADANLASCARIDTPDDVLLTKLASQNGVALLKADEDIRPVSLPVFQTAILQVPANIVVGGFSYGGLLGAPTITTGRVEDTKDLNGDTDVARLRAVVLDGDIGGPVMDRGGAILGVLLQQPNTDGRTLPANTQFARKWQSLAGLMSDAGITPTTTDFAADMHPEDLTAIVEDFTVTLRCWD